jgi:pyruvate dehydrogenase E2 component (dihydrolipoamide acetyltransferase)
MNHRSPHSDTPPPQRMHPPLATEVLIPHVAAKANAWHSRLWCEARSRLDGGLTPTEVERAAAGAPSGDGDRVGERQDRWVALRHAVSAAMARSKREIPHYYLERTIVLDPALAWLERENTRRPLSSRLLLIALQLKAVARAAVSIPEMNGHYTNGVFRPARAVHAGVAIALRPTGIVAPVLRDAEGKPLDILMREITDLVQRARAGTLQNEELGDGTLTVNSLGDRGADVVHAIIHPPQVAIVGFGRTHQAACVEADQVVVRHVCRMSLAADHRVSDGHRGSLFLAAVGDLLQRPEAL